MKNYFLLPCLFLVACQADPAPATSDSSTSTSQPAPGTIPTAAVVGNISVGSFEDWAADIDGSCWCLLSADPNEAGGYCFAFSRDGLAGKMLLDGEMRSLRRGASLSPGGSADYLSFLHDGAAYSIQTSINNEGEAEDEIFYSGKLAITRKSDGEQTSVQVSGSCGC